MDRVGRAIADTAERQQRRDALCRQWKQERFRTFQPVLRDNAVLDEEKGRILVFDYHYQTILILQADPLMAWQRTEDTGWRRVRPQLTLQGFTGLSGSVLGRESLPEHPEPDVAPDPETGRYSAHDWGSLRDIRRLNTKRKFVNSLGRSVRRVVGQFNDRNWQWSVLQLACRVPAAIGLLETNPALGFLVATNWVPRGRSYRTGRPLEWARRHIGKRRREIAARLGFPDSQAVVKVLGRVLPEACHPYRLAALRPVMAEPDTMKVLTHLPVLTKDIIRLVSTEGLREHVTPRLLLEACDEGAFRDAGVRYNLNRTPVSYMVRETVHVMAAFGRPTGGLVFHSLNQLRLAYESLHEIFGEDGVDVPLEDYPQNRRLQARLELAKMEARAREIRFGDPPIQGNDCIVPMTTGMDLVEEGREMHHCVATYVDRVHAARGRYYIYRLLPPLQRSTVAIQLTATGWRIEQIKGIYNEPVNNRTVRYVENWLAGRLEPGELPGDDEPVSNISAHARRLYAEIRASVRASAYGGDLLHEGVDTDDVLF